MSCPSEETLRLEMPHLLNTYNVHAHTQFYLLCQEEKERKNVNSVGASVPRPARAHALGGCKKEDSNLMCLPLVSVPELLSWYEHLTILVWFKCLKLHIFFFGTTWPWKASQLLHQVFNGENSNLFQPGGKTGWVGWHNSLKRNA